MTTRKPAKKSATKSSTSRSLKRTTGGEPSVVKGRQFEADVASLYRLQGAEVVQNVEICNKKVDILATFSHPVRHRLIVECKDESRPVNANQRVMQFHGLLTSARRTGEAESAEIISREPWGDAAKGYATREGIRLLTYIEKISSLIDFTHYLKDLISRFETIDPSRPSEPPLGKYYVDLSATGFTDRIEAKIDVLDTYVDQWLQSDTRRHLAIFGEYGAGKSTFCQKLACDLSKSFLRGPNSSRIPILLNLRDFVGKLDIEAYITSFLDRECRATNPKIDLFRAMNDAGIFLLLFDGLDEMAVKVDADTLEANLMEIEKLAASPKSKVILTSRPEFFVSVEEEEEAISPTMNPLLSRTAKYQPIKILPWDEPQVDQFLQRRVPLVKEATERWTYYRDSIREIGMLSDLSHRPVLLDMIVKTLPTLIANAISINRPNLYKTYLVGEIKRQKVQKKRTLLISEGDRLSLLQKMAVAVNDGVISAINFADASMLIAEELSPPKYELEAHARDFLTNSFLIRRGDEYHFSHKSILEYLVASQFADEIRRATPKSFGNTPLQTAVTDFLKDYEPEKKTLLRWIDGTRSKSFQGMKFLGGNAMTLLCALPKTSLDGQDLSLTDLTGADLRGVDLNNVKLDGALLRQAQLSGARFSKEQFNSAAINNVTALFLIVENRLIRGEFNEELSRVLRKILQTKRYHSRYRPTFTVEHAAGKYSMVGLQMNLTRKEYANALLKELRRDFSHVALYDNEMGQLLEKYPECKEVISFFGPAVGKFHSEGGSLWSK